MTDDPLTLPATPARLRRLADAAPSDATPSGGAVLDGAALDRALALATATPAAGEWRRFLSVSLALLGAGLALAGVVSFFAFNWARLGRFGKLGLIEAAIVVATAVGWWRRGLTSQVALTAAAVLVGPLLGVYGQAYQTGADPYGLFLTWAVVIVPWVVVARFPVLWVVFVAVLDVALALWWTQAVSSTTGSGEVASWVIVAAVHAAAVAAWEWQHRRPAPWLDGTWAARALAAAGFLALAAAATAFVFDPDGLRRRVNVPGLVGLLALAAAMAAAWTYHRRVRPDRFVLTTATMAGMAVATIALGRLLIAELRLSELGFLVLALVVVAEVTLGLRWLRAARSGAEREA